MGQLVFFSCEVGDGLREEVAGSVRVCVVGECVSVVCARGGEGLWVRAYQVCVSVHM